MKVKLLYFAGLREQVGTVAEEVELPSGVSTLADLRTYLAARGGAWQTAFAGPRLLRMALNQEMSQPSAMVRDGDEVAFFPPVTGG